MARQARGGDVQPRQGRRRSGRLRWRGAGNRHAGHEARQLPEPALGIGGYRVAVERRDHLSKLRAPFAADMPHQIVDERSVLPRRGGMKTLEHEPARRIW